MTSGSRVDILFQDLGGMVTCFSERLMVIWGHCKVVNWWICLGYFY
jgi:hypothetical protein